MEPAGLFYLAQLNVGRLLHPVEHPLIADFADNLNRINGLAERSPGFVWRFQTASGNATDSVHPWSSDPFFLVNLSVWETPEQLREFVYKSGHLEFLQRRAEWFEPMSEPHACLWWIPAGHIPTIEEAAGRLEHFQRHGPTPYAFWFSKLFPAGAIS